LKTPPPVDRAVSNVAWLLERFEQMQQSIRKSAVDGFLASEGASDPWSIANRVCDRYHIPGSPAYPTSLDVRARL
jgi:hypothetical protein